jgi:hypothetical protein
MKRATDESMKPMKPSRTDETVLPPGSLRRVAPDETVQRERREWSGWQHLPPCFSR